MNLLKKIGILLAGMLAAALAFFSFQSKKDEEVLKENERAKGKVDRIEEEIKDKLEEVKVQEKIAKKLEKQKKEVEDAKENTDDNINFINDKY